MRSSVSSGRCCTRLQNISRCTNATRVVGRLTVLRRAPDLACWPAWWVRCECGTEWITHASSLYPGGTQSCRDCGHARAGQQHRRQWSAEEAALLGTMPDAHVARRVGCSRDAVTEERGRRKIAPFAGPRRKRGRERNAKKRTNFRDLTDRSFGRLTVLEATDRRTPAGHMIWRCRCACGAVAFVVGTNLTSARGNTASCGRAGCRGRAPAGG